MAPKKTTKSKNVGADDLDTTGIVSSETQLKKYLQNILDKMKDENAAAIYIASAMNQLLNTPNVSEYFTNQNRELARDIWLRLKQSGIQLKNPPMLFEDGADIL